jgi:hypothetical protein
MSSLTQTAYMSRNIIKFGGIGVVVFVISWSILTGAAKAYKAAHPPYIAPTVKYGLLPKTVFPEKKYEKKSFSFEFPNDAVPKFKDQAKVYIIYRPNSSFLALEDDTKTANDLGFTAKPTQVSAGIYEFKNDTLSRTLTMNVLDGSFKMTYPYLNDQMLMTPGNTPAKEGAIDSASSFLKTANKYPTDIEQGEQKTSFWKIEFNGLKPVTAQADANITKVDFYRKDLDDGVKILSSDVDKAPISILVSGANVENKKVVEVTYKYANIDRESFSTYPIKTSSQAMEDLKSGNYWPASDSKTNDVIIRKMYLAYFEPVTLTNYMQPIYVFQGDNGFMAYVPAIVDKYIQK